MAFKFKTWQNEKGETIHQGTCGHEYPGTGKRGRPFTECPKCRKAAATEAKPRKAHKKAAKKSAEALV